MNTELVDAVVDGAVLIPTAADAGGGDAVAAGGCAAFARSAAAVGEQA